MINIVFTKCYNVDLQYCSIILYIAFCTLYINYILYITVGIVQFQKTTHMDISVNQNKQVMWKTNCDKLCFGNRSLKLKKTIPNAMETDLFTI